MPILTRMTSLILPAALCLPGPLFANLEEHETKVSLGYVGTTGNTDARSFNTEFISRLKLEDWTHHMRFQGLSSRENARTNAERYYLEGKSDYQVSDRGYVYFRGSFTDDRFSGYNYQTALTGGYGHHFRQREDFTLEGFSGLGYRFNELDTGENEDEVIILSIGENLVWRLNESTRLTQSFTTEIGQELTVTRFEAGLISDIVDRVATKIAFEARHLSEVPDQRVNTDTQTSISLVYDF